MDTAVLYCTDKSVRPYTSEIISVCSGWGGPYRDDAQDLPVIDLQSRISLWRHTIFKTRTGPDIENLAIPVKAGRYNTLFASLLAYILAGRK